MKSEAGLVGERKKGVSGRVIFNSLALSLLVAAQTATQVVASDFSHPAQFGRSLHGVYWPWAIVTWHSKWGLEHPEPFNRAMAFGTLAFAVCAGIFVAVAKGMRGRPTLYGSARWATAKDLVEAELLPSRSVMQRLGLQKPADGEPYVYFGAWGPPTNRHYLRHRGDGNALLMAGTGKGKGINVVLPNLLSWTGCVFVTDMKGELYEKTAGWRHKHANNRVLRFEPLATTNTARYNPLAEIRVGTEWMEGDAMSIAQLIADPEGESKTDHFSKTGLALLEALILHVVLKAEREGTPGTLGEVTRLAYSPDDSLWVDMRDYPHHNGKPHPVVRLQALSMISRLEKGGEEASSTIATTQGFLSIYRNSILARNVSSSDFSLRTLMDESQPTSFYFVIPSEQQQAVRPLVRLMLALSLRLLAPDPAKARGSTLRAHKFPMLMMLDEVMALKKIRLLEETLAYNRSYRIRIMMIVQDRAQITNEESGYGRNEAITANCRFQMALAPDSVETAEYLSRLVGNTTEEHVQLSKSGGKTTKTYQLVKRPLLDPSEVRRMPPFKMKDGRIVEGGEALLFAPTCPPIYVNLVPYFLDETFSARADLPPPRMSTPTEMW